MDPVIQFPLNSQSLNPYSYILNNPLSGTDPTGYRSICVGGSCNGVMQVAPVPPPPKPLKLPQTDPDDRGKSRPSDPCGGRCSFGAGSNGSDGGSGSATKSREGSSESSQPSEKKSNEGQQTLDAIEVTASKRSEVTQVNMTVDYYLENIRSVWRNVPISPSGLKGNKGITSQVERLRRLAPKGSEDIQMSQADIDFVNAIAVPTYNVMVDMNEGKENPTEFYVQSTFIDGVPMIVGLARVPQNGEFLLEATTTLVTHWHTVQDGESIPSDIDNWSAKINGIPSAVVTPNNSRKCCNIFEVGRQNGLYKYRSIKGGETGDWKKGRKEWNK